MGVSRVYRINNDRMRERDMKDYNQTCPECGSNRVIPYITNKRIPNSSKNGTHSIKLMQWGCLDCWLKWNRDVEIAGVDYEEADSTAGTQMSM